MKKATKFGLLLAGVAAGTFYLVNRFAGALRRPKVSAPAHPETTHTQAPSPPPTPHGSTVSKPNPATPADPFAPLPGQEDLQGNVHFDQPGDASSNIHFDQQG